MRLLTLLFGLGFATAAAAAEPARLFVAPVVTERIDGAESRGGRGETTIMDGLRTAGYRVIPPAGLPEVREALAAGTVAGRYAQIDWLLAIEIDASALSADVMGTGMARHEGIATALVIAADTGELVGTVEATGQGMDVAPRASTKMAAKKAAAALVTALQAKRSALLSARRSVALTVAGVPDAEEAAALATRLQALSTVDRAAVRSFGETTTLGLEVADGVPALASAIERARGLGIAVAGYTTRALDARYVPARRVIVPVRVGPIENATGFADEDWLRGAIGQIVVAELGNHPAMRAAFQDGGPAKAMEVPAWLGTGAVSGPDAPLVFCTGRFRYEGDGAELELTLHATEDGRRLASVRERGPRTDFRLTVARATRALSDEAAEAVSGDRVLRAKAGISAEGAKALAATSKRPAPAVDVEFQPVLTGDLLRGRLKIRPPKSPAMDGLSVRLVSAAFSAPVPVEVPTPKGAVEVPLELPLGAPSAGPGTFYVEVEASWRADGRWHTERLVKPVMRMPGATAARAP